MQIFSYKILLTKDLQNYNLIVMKTSHPTIKRLSQEQTQALLNLLIR